MDEIASGSDEPSLRGRIIWAWKKLWLGSQTRMAADLGLSQGSLANVLNGRRAPGRDMLSAIASHPLIRGEWLITGEGPPLTIAESSRDHVRSALPVAKRILMGQPAENPHLLSLEVIPVPSPVYRPTRYWYRLPAQTPCEALQSIKAEASDLLLLETDDRYRTGESVRELGFRPCSVLIRRADEHEACLGLLRQPSAEQRAAGLVPVNIYPWQGAVFTSEIHTRSSERRERVVELDQNEPPQFGFVRLLAIAVQLVRSYSA
jgi:transcriptional regulator with XRE-family HTH domain